MTQPNYERRTYAWTTILLHIHCNMKLGIGEITLVSSHNVNPESRGCTCTYIYNIIIVLKLHFVCLSVCPYGRDFGPTLHWEVTLTPKHFLQNRAAQRLPTLLKALAYYCRQARRQISYTRERREKRGPTLTCTYASLYSTTEVK